MLNINTNQISNDIQEKYEANLKKDIISNFKNFLFWVTVVIAISIFVI